MTSFQRAIKYSLIYGFIGAVLLPLIHESYANIGKTFSLLVLALLVLAMTIKLSMFGFKEAFIGITLTLSVSCVLGECLYFGMYEKIAGFLEKNAEYFSLGITEHFRYYISAAAILLSGYAVCLLIFGFKRLIRRFKDNQKAAQSYIDNAFDGLNSKKDGQ